MRCLYCGIRLKIAETAQPIKHCPECSMRIEYERRNEALFRTRASGGARRTEKGRPPLALAAPRGA
jgi:hypothetical protein